MRTTRSHQTRRALAHRSSNGIDVVLVDDDNGDSFELVVDPAEALDVFHHPYADAAFHGASLDRAPLADAA